MMPIILPHANHYSIDLASFLAAWKKYVELYFPDAEDWQTFGMPRLNQKAVFNPDCKGLDSLCRILSVNRQNTMQASDKFMKENKEFIQGTSVINPATGNEVNGASLQKTAVQFWNQLSDACKQQLDDDAERILSADHDIPDEEIQQVNPNDQAIELFDYQRCERGQANFTHSELWPRFVKAIHESEYQPQYRRKNHGNPVTGWQARWASYFWPNPNRDAGYTMTNLKPLMEALRLVIAPFAEACRSNTLAALTVDEAWPTEEEKQKAIDVANNIFRWGGVPQQNVTANTVFCVLQSAILGQRVGDAPMNSGWTKLAAFATDKDVLDCPSTPPQVIWDSRVSVSVVKRICEQMTHNEFRDNFNQINLRQIRGRGGNRLVLNAYLRDEGWPLGWGQNQAWNAHFSGGLVVQSIADALNDDLETYGRDPSTGNKWSLRSVEMVLFMDGY